MVTEREMYGDKPKHMESNLAITKKEQDMKIRFGKITKVHNSHQLLLYMLKKNLHKV